MDSYTIIWNPNLFRGKVMEIVLVILAIIIVCTAVFLKGKAWNSFVDDLSPKDKSEDKQ